MCNIKWNRNSRLDRVSAAPIYYIMHTTRRYDNNIIIISLQHRYRRWMTRAQSRPRHRRVTNYRWEGCTTANRTYNTAILWCMMCPKTTISKVMQIFINHYTLNAKYLPKRCILARIPNQSVNNYYRIFNFIVWNYNLILFDIIMYIMLLLHITNKNRVK